ncbi:MAG: GFA family protein [Hydrogenophaga sp.]|uniref:GFA family protein n=1 Tax=Hydrogenophaga sp. TaxID=1904254 RepID=UPI002717CB03|nr:GFA family protein [Hydrogenophaga sp.]MDO9568321.1 GFA family protein [Hydrogenophaga sp.]MDP3374258.1 GFA family protein [Hydrogenophaga sp.]
MSETFEGQCQCGGVKYRVKGTAATVFVCHCTECQRQSASAFGMALWLRQAEVDLVCGALNEWTRLMPSGRSMVCSFCPTCGTRLFHRVLGQSALLSIKPGTLNNARALVPVGHIWTSSKQAWVCISDTQLQYVGNPPDFDGLLAAWGASHA